MATVAEALQLALQHHQAGRLQEAERLYRQILQADPGQADALHLLGLVAHQVGRHEAAIEWIRKALAVQPRQAGYWCNLGVVYQAMRNWAEAEACFQQAVQLQSIHPEAHYQLGNALLQQGSHERAIASLRQAVTQKPDHAEAHHLLGVAQADLHQLEAAAKNLETAVWLKPTLAAGWSSLGQVRVQQSRLDEAIACFQRAVQEAPQSADLRNNLGAALTLHGHMVEAVSAYRQAIQLRPAYPTAHHNLGMALSEQRQFAEAAAAYREAIRLQPDYAEAWKSLGALLCEQEQFEQAVPCLEEAVRLRPQTLDAYEHLAFAHRQQGEADQAAATYQRALQICPTPRGRILAATLLPPLYRSAEELMEKRSHFLENLRGLLIDGCTLDPTREVVPNPFYLAYQGLNERDTQRDLAKLYVPSSQPALTPRAPGTRLKIGFISRHFRHHTIGRLMQGFVAQLRRPEFFVSVISVGQYHDPLADFFKQHADEYVVLPTNLTAARSILEKLRLDVLFYADLGMDGLTYSLAFSRFAPVQCVTWGHPVTTGIPTIDYFISSDLLETPDADEHYTEKLIRLRTLPSYYYRPIAPPVLKPRNDFGLPEEGHLYACLQNLFKFHPEFDPLLAEILRRDPQGRVVLIRSRHPSWNEQLQQRFARSMPDVQDRIHFLPWQDHASFLSLNAACDVLLDPIHFGSGNTCYEGLSLGVPIVTWPSPYLRGRVTLGLYRKMNVHDCVAHSGEEYVNLAVRLGTDAEYRGHIREKLFAASAAVFEDGDAVRALEEFFQRAVAEAD